MFVSLTLGHFRLLRCVLPHQQIPVGGVFFPFPLNTQLPPPLSVETVTHTWDIVILLSCIHTRHSQLFAPLSRMRNFSFKPGSVSVFRIIYQDLTIVGVDDQQLSSYQTRAKWPPWLLRKTRPFIFKYRPLGLSYYYLLIYFSHQGSQKEFQTARCTTRGWGAKMDGSGKTLYYTQKGSIPWTLCHAIQRKR